MLAVGLFESEVVRDGREEIEGADSESMGLIELVGLASETGMGNGVGKNLFGSMAFPKIL